MGEASGRGAAFPMSGKRGSPGMGGSQIHGLEVTALVASWTEGASTERARFGARVAAFASHLPPDGSLVLAIRQCGASKLQFRAYISRTEGDAACAAVRLGALLSERTSPVVAERMSQEEAHRGITSVPDSIYELRRPVFAASRAARRRPMPLWPREDFDPAGIFAALAGVPIPHELRLCLAPLPAQPVGEEAIALALGLNGELAPDAVVLALREHGSLVRCQFLAGVGGKSRIDPLLMSELGAAAVPLESVPVPHDREADAVRVWQGGTPRPLQGRTPTTDLLIGSARAAALLPLPLAVSGTYPGFQVDATGMVRAELRVSEASAEGGLRLGQATDLGGNDIDVRLSLADFARHVYVPGQTGAGKSTALRAICCELASHGHGFLFLDPHGETARQLLAELPSERAKDVTFVDCADPLNPAPINPFAVSDPLQVDAAVANTAAMFGDLFDPTQLGIVGPRWETWFRMAMLTLIAAQGERASLLDVPLLFLDAKYLEACKGSVTEDYLLDFWDREMAQTDRFHKSEVLGWFNSKFTAFRTNAVLRAVLGSGHDVLSPQEAMDAGRIILVSLEKGRVGAPVSQLLGYVYLTRFWTAAMKRRGGPPFGLVVDEAHTFSKGALPDVLAEGRKFGLAAVIANQYLEQFPDAIRSALLGNVGSVLGFRLGERDAEVLGGRFAPEFEAAALRRMRNFRAACSLLVHGAPAPAFSLYVDHFDRVASAPAARGRKQERTILRQSQRFFKAERDAVRRLTEEKNMQRTDGAAVASKRDGPRRKRAAHAAAEEFVRGAEAWHTNPRDVKPLLEEIRPQEGQQKGSDSDDG